MFACKFTCRSEHIKSHIRRTSYILHHNKETKKQTTEVVCFEQWIGDLNCIAVARIPYSADQRSSNKILLIRATDTKQRGYIVAQTQSSNKTIPYPRNPTPVSNALSTTCRVLQYNDADQIAGCGLRRLPASSLAKANSARHVYAARRRVCIISHSTKQKKQTTEVVCLSSGQGIRTPMSCVRGTYPSPQMNPPNELTPCLGLQIYNINL